MTKERVRYYSPLIENYRSNLILSGQKGTKAQRDVRGWWHHSDDLKRRMKNRRSTKKTWDKYWNMYGSAKKRGATFKNRWKSEAANNPNYKNMSGGLRRAGYWPNPEGTGVEAWKRYTNKMFNSLVAYYKPDRLYPTLHKPVNRLIYKRAIRTAKGLGGLEPPK